MTGGGWLTAAQAGDLVELVRAAIDARRAYERIACEPAPADPLALPDWGCRSGDAHEAAMAAERDVIAAIRALRRTS